MTESPREIAYFCPVCQSMCVAANTVIAAVGGAPRAECRECGWRGDATEVLGAISPEGAQFWTPERIATVLLRGVAKHAAGPLLQLLELIGVVPPLAGAPGSPQYASAASCREAVMKAVLGAAVTAAFETAAEVVPAHYAAYATPQHAEAVGKVFEFKPATPKLEIV